MHTWTPFPHSPGPLREPATLLEDWERLHAGDALPPPHEPRVLLAWALFHAGQFQRAAELGLATGGEGFAVADKATCVYANYLEPDAARRSALFHAVVERTAQQLRAEPHDPQAHYWHAYALGRYSHGVSLARALAQGLGTQVKAALERAIELEPRHADAHLALATFHAEVIDKLGSLIGSMTYGVQRETAQRLFRQALRLNPSAPAVLIEYANGLVMLEGDAQTAQATRFYEQASASRPADAAERLDVDVARAGLSA